MGINRVMFGNRLVMDITDSTVDAEHLAEGYTAYDETGTKITGNLVINKYYTGSTDPASSLGYNGDLYLKVGG